MKPTPSGGSAVGRKQRLLLKVERFSRRRYRLVFLMALLAVVAASWLGSRLRFESDVLKLIPSGNRKVDTFKLALEAFGSIDYLLVLLEAEGTYGPDELEDLADLAAERLEAHPELVEMVEYRFQPDARFLDLFSRNALLFLPPSDLAELETKLSDEVIRTQIEENRLSLASPTATLTEGLILRDPLGLMPLLLDRILGNRSGLDLDLSDGYYLSRDGKNLILLVKPTAPSQNIEFDRTLLAATRGAFEAARQELWEERTGDETGSIRVRYGGNYALVLEESELIREDMRFNFLFSFFAVSGLYWLCYRRFAALFYSGLPLMVGQALTFALAYFVLGRLNSASSGFTALLMGLGTDFSIVMYARYVEERRRGADLAEATELMVGETGLGVFTGAITSAGTFLAMCVSSFGGLYDLGLLIGSGILLCGIAILFLLPAMIKWNEGVRKRRTDPVRKLHLQSFGLERLIPFAARHRVLTLVGIGALTAVGLYHATRLEFDDSLMALRSNKTEAGQVQKEIADRFGASLSYMMAIAEADTLDEAIALSHDVESRLKPFLENGTIGAYESILTYLPPGEDQRRIIRALREGGEGAFDAARIRATFVDALVANGFRVEAFEEYLASLDGMLSPERPLTLVDLERQGLERLVSRYVHHGQDAVRIVTYLYPTDQRWKREAPPGLVEALAGGDERIVVTGTNVVGRELRALFTRDALRAVFLGLGLVFVLLLLDFRSLKLTVVAMVQLLTGVAMMMGLMQVLGYSINYVNAFVATMILGVGIDYSIHLVHRMNLNGGVVDAGLLETGKAVVMAALTNVAGFGTLSLGNYPALRSFGTVALLGSVTCLLTSLTLVPALMARRDTRTS